MMRWVVVLALPAMLVGCGSAGESSVQPETVVLTEGSLEAYGVLGFLNGPSATFEVLDNDVGLDQRAARNIVDHVRGGDGALGTSDDDLLETIGELDAIPYVGEAALDKLRSYVASIGGMPDLVVEDVPLTQAQADAIVALVNTATADQLDVDVGLDSRAVSGLMAGRPFADIDGVADVTYVGKTAIEHLRDYVNRNASPVPGGPGDEGTDSDAAWRNAAMAESERLVVDGDASPFEVPAGSTPPAAQTRVEIDSILGGNVPSTYALTVQERQFYLVLATDGSGEGNVVVADLIDAAGEWFAHGIGHQVWDGGSGLSWSLDDTDPTLCVCAAGAAMATCTWLDGAASSSASLACVGTEPVEVGGGALPCSGGTYDSVTFTAEEECRAVEFINKARYSQMASLSDAARRTAYDCRPTESGIDCTGYRASAWQSLTQYSAADGVGQTGVSGMKTASAAWTYDGLSFDTVANSWNNRVVLKDAGLTFERVFVVRRTALGCYELRDKPGAANWLTACAVSHNPEPNCTTDCFDAMIGKYVWLRGVWRQWASGAYRLNLQDREPGQPSPALFVDTAGFRSIPAAGLPPLTGGGVRRYRYVHGGLAYFSPPTTAAWSWSAGVELVGVYQYGTEDGILSGSINCQGSSEKPQAGVGCSDGPAATEKVLVMSDQATPPGAPSPSTSSGPLCQDVPGIFGLDPPCPVSVVSYRDN